ncbi:MULTISPECIES: beta-eliminating lyase-related protein [Kitasatospora]|uniref:Putative L-threonine aldolase n=1 Tax=Kitasatospora setae (strain ATCC 33774 / DSM 43861 / JCM 3304 / KCC A-0304 / NBRC 14216 / KM-6054) TaxID=452652 RepID=E4NDE1_KITSK|nr:MULTISPECIES: beta-eliminating lyase-related protein [Kitasatospora]BAJ29222.1 putative L-threonine aldolase [Kitasatospora setae KM-6054]
MNDTPVQDRRFHARRRAGRLLSAGRQQTVRESLAALAALADGPYPLDEPTDRYGDGIVRTLELRTAALLGKPDAAYFPTGTMAQQAALKTWADTHGPVVAMHPLAHPEQHERRAHQVLSGLRSVPLTGAPRQPAAAELAELDEPYDVLMLELPLRDAGFLLPGWDELEALYALAERQGRPVHLDGARLWESAPHFGRSLPEVCARAGSVYVSCYKSLGGHSGALVAGEAEYVRRLKVWRHRYGGSLWQQWPAALAALAGLDRELPRLPGYVAHAKTVAAALAAAPGARVHPEPPHTHQFQFWLPYPAARLEEAGFRQAEEQGVSLFGGWREPGPHPGLSMTEVTVAADAADWSAEQVTEALDAFLALV